jgi:cytoskeletal protein RodZ
VSLFYHFRLSEVFKGYAKSLHVSIIVMTNSYRRHKQPPRHKQLPPPQTATATTNKQLPPPQTATAATNSHSRHKQTATAATNSHRRHKQPPPPQTATSATNSHCRHKQRPLPQTATVTTNSHRRHKQTATAATNKHLCNATELCVTVHSGTHRQTTHCNTMNTWSFNDDTFYDVHTAV